MRRRFILAACCALIATPLAPASAPGQQLIGGVRLVGSYLEAPFFEDDNSAAFVFVRVTPRDSEIPWAGVAYDRYLASTVLGALSMRVDLAAALADAGLGVTINWQPYEVITISLRIDVLQQRLSGWVFLDI